MFGPGEFAARLQHPVGSLGVLTKNYYVVSGQVDEFTSSSKSFVSLIDVQADQQIAYRQLSLPIPTTFEHGP